MPYIEQGISYYQNSCRLSCMTNECFPKVLKKQRIHHWEIHETVGNTCGKICYLTSWCKRRMGILLHTKPWISGGDKSIFAVLFTSEDRLCTSLRAHDRSTNMTSQCQYPTFAWRHRSTVVTSQEKSMKILFNTKSEKTVLSDNGEIGDQ